MHLVRTSNLNAAQQFNVDRRSHSVAEVILEFLACNQRWHKHLQLGPVRIAAAVDLPISQLLLRVTCGHESSLNYAKT